MGRPPARAPLAPPAADGTALTAAGIRAGDLYVCISEGWDAGFTVHAVACLITYAVCSYPRPFVHYCACFFLLYELSTPFMHLRTPRPQNSSRSRLWLHRGRQSAICFEMP